LLYRLEVCGSVIRHPSSTIYSGSILLSSDVPCKKKNHTVSRTVIYFSFIYRRKVKKSRNAVT
jgi:hypothetical protein